MKSCTHFPPILNKKTKKFTVCSLLDSSKTAFTTNTKVRETKPPKLHMQNASLLPERRMELSILSKLSPKNPSKA